MRPPVQRISRLVCTALIVGGSVSFSQAARVIIKAEASVDYVKRNGSITQDSPVRYHFVEGKFFKGYVKDKSLLAVSFFDIAENLAGHLSKHNYIPTGNVKENEVMILVNWGVTAVEDSFEDLHGIDSDEEYDQMFGAPVASESSEGETEISYEVRASPNWGAMGLQSNSKMLGFWETMHDGSLMPSEHHEFQTLLKEERYFIVVIAFDNQKYLKGEKKILWSTRFSMRARGKPFDEAYVELTSTASDYFGRELKGLTRKRFDDRSRVKLGDIQVLDTVDDGNRAK